MILQIDSFILIFQKYYKCVDNIKNEVYNPIHRKPTKQVGNDKELN